MALKRESIISALVSRLQAILTTSGYYTNLGSHVFTWLQRPLTADELPALIVRDTLRTPLTLLASGALSKQNQDLLVEIEIAVSPGSATPTTIRKALADVFKAALGSDRTLGGYAFDIRDGGDEIIFGPQEDRQIAGAIARVIVSYRTTELKED